MEARANVQFVRIAPRKVGVVLDLIRGKDLETAMAIVRNTPPIFSLGLICRLTCCTVPISSVISSAAR